MSETVLSPYPCTVCVDRTPIPSPCLTRVEAQGVCISRVPTQVSCLRSRTCDELPPVEPPPVNPPSEPVPVMYSWEQAPWQNYQAAGSNHRTIGDPITFRLVVWDGFGFIQLGSQITVQWADMWDVRATPVPAKAWLQRDAYFEASPADIALIKANGNTVYYQSYEPDTDTWLAYGDILAHPERHPCGALSGSFTVSPEIVNLRVDFFVQFDSNYHPSGYTIIDVFNYFWPNVGLYESPGETYTNYAYVTGKVDTAIRLPFYYDYTPPNPYRGYSPNAARYYGEYTDGEALALGNNHTASIGGWIKIDDQDSLAQTFGSIQCNIWYIRPYQNNSSTYKLWLFTQAMTVSYLTDMNLNYGEWYFVYVTYDGSKVRLYINNVKVYESVADSDYLPEPNTDSEKIIVTSLSYGPNSNSLIHALFYFENISALDVCLTEGQLSEMWNGGNGVP